MAVQCVLDVTAIDSGLPMTDDQTHDWSDWPTQETGGAQEASPQVGVGLDNLGNTCWQNAVIQCLFHNNSFVHKLIKECTTSTASDVKDSESDHQNNDQTVAHLLVQLYRQYQNQKCGSIRAQDFHSAVSRRHVSLGDGRQHDAQEFLALLLDAIHEQLKSPIERAVKRAKVDDCLSEWLRDRETNGSSCVDTFQGQMCGTIQCDNCGHVSQTYEPFRFLALPLPVTRQTKVKVEFTPLNGQTVCHKLIIDNKYDSVNQLKHKLRQKVSDITCEDRDLAVAQLSDNGRRIARVVDDSEDVLSLDTSQEVAIFELNPIVDNEWQQKWNNESNETKNCLICQSFNTFIVFVFLNAMFVFRSGRETIVSTVVAFARLCRTRM